MDQVFPFGFPLTTLLYLVLYVVTLAIHVVFMNYVLAGTGYLAIVSVFRGKQAAAGPMGAKLRHWMPAMLSGAITAGVAPLLFVQILYKQEFYSANLLLNHRFMAILPILIIAFYMLYLIQARKLEQWWLAGRTVLTVVAFACFAFIAYSWTENYLLSMARDTWHEHYVSRSAFYFDSAQLPRLAVWFIGAVPTMALLVAWQLWYTGEHADDDSNAQTQAGAAGQADGQIEGSAEGQVDRTQKHPPAPRSAATWALIGIALTLAAGLWQYVASPEPVQQVFQSTMAAPWFAAALLGVVVQIAAWVMIIKRSTLATGWLIVASVGLGLTIVGMTAVRSAIRITAVGSETMQQLTQVHQQIFERSGMASFLIFLFFFVANIVIVLACFRMVRKGTLPAQS